MDSSRRRSAMATSLAKFEDWITQDTEPRFQEDEHTYYLSGPMSGKQHSNFPLFRRAARILRERGFNIISPVELDHEEAELPPWAELIGRDVSVLISQCDGIIMLPDWALSQGARIELFVAITCGKSLLEFADNEEWLPVVALLKESWAMEILRSNTLASDAVL